MRMMALLCAPLLGCFSPDYGAIPIKCDADNPCPQGMVCGQGVCQSVPTSDAGGADAAADMSKAPTAGCASGNGAALAGNVSACPGAFSAGQARALCASGWHVCTAATGINLSACGALSGFFVADVPGYRLSDASINGCGGTINQDRLFFGCGKAQPYVFSAFMACSGFGSFVRWLRDGTSNQYWDLSAGYNLDQAVNHIAADGVLCCM